MRVDCPYGWPDTFRSTLDHHARDTLTPCADDDEFAKKWRRDLAFNRCDFAVTQALNPTKPLANLPLSVAADRLGLTAMRMASLLAPLGTEGVLVDRSGNSGKVIEVYPAAALPHWEFAHHG